MTLELYVNNSDRNVVKKVLTLQATVTGTMRSGTSILDPDFDIEVNPYDQSDFTWINYVHVADWNRYYYVNNITSIVNGLWRLSCHVDVLMTFKTAILAQNAILARQEKVYNLYLDDNKFLVNAKSKITTKAFPRRVIPGSGTNSRAFVLTMASGFDDPVT